MRAILSHASWVSRTVFAACLFSHLSAAARADIYEWEYVNPSDPSQGKRQGTTLTPGGAGVDAVPGADLTSRNLTMAYLVGADLTGANANSAGLSHADLRQASLTNVDFLGAVLAGADFTDSEVRGASFQKAYSGTGITLEQLYSTMSYQIRDLTGISLGNNDLSGGNFAGQNLTNAYLSFATLTGANFADAEVRGASFEKGYEGNGISLSQLYSTVSYQAGDLTGVRLAVNDLSRGNFAGQNLTNANFDSATLAGANFTGAVVRGASFYGSYDSNTNRYVGGLTLAQLYSTASYQAHDLTAIGLGGTDLSGGNFAGQHLANADLGNATLTGADFTGAVVRGAKFNKQTNVGTGITLEQLYSTASYQADDLSGIDLQLNNLAGANFASQNLTNSTFSGATLTDADFSGANLTNANVAATLTGADFTGANVRGASFYDSPGYATAITLAQLYSTASYEAHDLRGITLQQSDLAGGNFAGQNFTGAAFFGANLTGADLSRANLADAAFTSATLTDADFTDADVRGARFDRYPYSSGTGITVTQLYSTASYQDGDSSGIGLTYYDLAGTNFARQNLKDADFGAANLTNANLREADLANANFTYYSFSLFWGFISIPSTMTGADLTAADARGASGLDLWDATTANFIKPDGCVDGLDLDAGGLLVVRDYDGNPTPAPRFFFPLSPTPPTPITVDQHLAMGPGGTLRMIFEADAWDSTISFAPGIPVALGGMLELTFADDVNLASQVGRTFQLFDWTGVVPTGSFDVVSPYAWDLSELYSTGEVTLLTVPEPSGILLATCALAVILATRRANSLPRRPLRVTASIFSVIAITSAAHADIYEWEYINPIDPSQGKRQSTTLVPDGHGVDAVAGADLASHNLTMAYLIDADLRNSNLFSASLINADFAGAQIQGASFYASDITVAQLYSTASYRHQDLSGILLGYTRLAGSNFARQTLKNSDFGGATLTGASFQHANLANAEFAAPGFCIPYGGSSCSGPIYASLSGTDFTAADARGAQHLAVPASAITTNLIFPDGHINGLDLDAVGLLIVRDYDVAQYDLPIPITVDEHLTMGPGGTLRMVFGADAWDSTISFAPGIPVTLGGTLELTFADDVNLASKVGRTFKLFDWNGVDPAGQFSIVSPYAWDLSKLYAFGEATLTAVPEPASVALAASIGCLFLRRDRRRGIHSQTLH